MMLSRWLIVVAYLGFTSLHSSGQTPVSQPTEVLVVGVYKGTYPPGGVQTTNTNRVGVVTVKVGEVKKPIILVLTACESVLWKVEAPKGAVVKVIASGYNTQAVEGLDAKVPITFLSYEAGDKDYFHARSKEGEAYESDSEKAAAKRKYEHLVRRVKELTQQDIKEFRGQHQGDVIEIK